MSFNAGSNDLTFGVSFPREDGEQKSVRVIYRVSVTVLSICLRLRNLAGLGQLIFKSLA